MICTFNFEVLNITNTDWMKDKLLKNEFKIFSDTYLHIEWIRVDIVCIFLGIFRLLSYSTTNLNCFSFSNLYLCSRCEFRDLLCSRR